MNYHTDPHPGSRNSPYGSKSGSANSPYGSKEKFQFKCFPTKFKYKKIKNQFQILSLMQQKYTSIHTILWKIFYLLMLFNISAERSPNLRTNLIFCQGIFVPDPYLYLSMRTRFRIRLLLYISGSTIRIRITAFHSGRTGTITIFKSTDSD